MADLRLHRTGMQRGLSPSVRRAVMLGVVFAAFFAAYFHRMGLAVITPQLEAAFGLSAVTLGLLGAAYFYPYSLSQIPIGVLVDALGPRFMLGTFLTIAAAGSVLFGLAGSFEQALLGRLMVGFGVAAVYLSAQRLFINWFHPRQFATLTGFINAAGNLGGISASLPLVALAAVFGWRDVFVAAGVVMLIPAALAFGLIRNSPVHPRLGPALASYRRESAWSTVRRGMGVVASEGHLWPLAIGLLPYVGTRFGFQSLWGGPYLAEIYHLSAEEIGTLMMIMSLSVVISSPLAGFLSDRVFPSRKWFAVGGLALNTLCWLPLTFTAGSIPVLAFYPLVIALGALSCMWIPVYAQAKELHTAAVAGTVLAVLQFATSFGGAVYQQLLGVVIGLFAKTPSGYPLEAYSAAFGVCLASCAFATVLIGTSKEVRGKLRP